MNHVSFFPRAFDGIGSEIQSQKNMTPLISHFVLTFHYKNTTELVWLVTELVSV